MAVWEAVENDKVILPDGTYPSRTERMRVFGGYLYRTSIFGFGSQGKGLPPAIATHFVPDNRPETIVV